MGRFARFSTICAIQKNREKHPWSSVTFDKFAG